MKLRHAAAVAGIAALLVTGCGGGDDDSGDSGATGSEGTAVVAITPKDEAAIAGVSDKLEKAAKARNGKAVCELLQPALIDDAFGSKAKCAKQVGRAVSQQGLQDLKVDEVTATATGATASFKGVKGRSIDFVKIGGEWYIDLSGSVSPDATIPSG